MVKLRVTVEEVDEEGKLQYKVKREIRQIGIAEIRLFEKRQEAMEQFRVWLHGGFRYGGFRK